VIVLPDLSHWVTEIKDNAPLFETRAFKTVPDDDLQIDKQQSPCAFVYLSADKSGENGLLTEVRQPLSGMITIEIIMRRTATRSDQFNETDSDNLRLYRTEVISALLGKLLNGQSTAIEHVGGQLIKKDKKYIKWADTFTADSYLSTL